VIKKIILRNFQSHRKTVLNLGPGLNVFLGLSDSGKSSVIRAITWVALGRPIQDVYGSHWGGTTSVKIVLDDGTKVVREKGKENLYILERPGKERQEFRAFKFEVPQEVREALSLETENFFLQYDNPYMLSQSSGEVARRLNRVAHLELIDESISNLQSDIRQFENDVKKVDADIKSEEKLLSDLRYLDDFEEDLVRLERKDERKKEIQAQFEILSRLVSEVKIIQEKIDKLSHVEMDWDIVKKTLSKIAEVQRLRANLGTITNDIKGYRNIKREMKHLASAVGFEDEVCQILKSVSLLDEKKNTVYKLREVIGEVRETTSNIRRLKQEIIPAKEREYNQNFPDVCPFCGAEKGGSKK